MYIKVRVTPNVKKESVKEEKGTFFISVKEPAERNLANTRVVELIQKHFNAKNVRIVSGYHSPSKILSVD